MSEATDFERKKEVVRVETTDSDDSVMVTMVGIIIHYIVDGVAFAVSGCSTFNF